MRLAVRKGISILTSPEEPAGDGEDPAASLVLRAVTAAVTILEDDDAFNAGYGSVLNEMGEVEMDAAVMDGKDLKFGAVTSLGERN